MEWTSTARKWQKIFQDYESGDLRRKEFCETKGVKLSTFDYWRSRLKKTAAKGPAVVEVTTVKRPGEPIRIHVNEQIVVELNGDAEEEQLRRVLKGAAGL
jgi:transposase-like protein